MQSSRRARAPGEPSSGGAPDPALYESAALLTELRGQARAAEESNLAATALETVRCPASATHCRSPAASMFHPLHACPLYSLLFIAENKKGREPLGARPLKSPIWVLLRAGPSPIAIALKRRATEQRRAEA